MRVPALALLFAAFACHAVALRAEELPYTNPFSPPQGHNAAEGVVHTIQRALDDRDLIAAATAADDLLRLHDGELIARPDGLWITPAAWLDALPRPDRLTLQNAYRLRYDATARDAIAAARSDPAAPPEELYRVARRYWLASSAAEALAEAADRAVRYGDPWMALACYGLAVRLDLALSPSRQANLAACRNSVSAAGGFSGPMPVDASWYAQADCIADDRYIPSFYSSHIYVAGSREVFALYSRGGVAWAWQAQPGQVRPPERRRDRGRGPVYLPSALATDGQARILIVRQCRVGGNEFVLRAFRAADGSPLWTSESQGTLATLSFAANPLVVGRHVYAVGKDYRTNPAEIVLVALSLMEGKVLYQTTLGTLTHSTIQLLQNRRDEDQDSGAGWDDFHEQTESAVEGDLLFTAPNTGFVIALSRIDGRLRWMRAYEKSRDAESSGDRLQLRILPPRDARELARWSNTPRVCGNTLVAAPQDATAVMAYDIHSGAVRWKNDSLAGWTLLGATPRLAVFAGSSVQAIDAATGRTAWKHVMARDQTISGPGALSGGVVYVPTNRGLVMLDADTGSPRDNAPRPPDVAKLLREETHPVVAGSGIAATFENPYPDAIRVDDQEITVPRGPAPEAVIDALASFAPGWNIAHCAAAQNIGLRGEYRGRSPTFVTSPVSNDTPCTLYRVYRMPRDRKHALKVRVSHENNSSWRFVAKVNGRVVQDKIIDRSATGESWLRLYIDLMDHAGKQVLVELEHHAIGAGSSLAFWSDLLLENR